MRKDSTIFGTIDSAQATVSGYSFINRESMSFSTAALGAMPFFGLGFKVEKAAESAFNRIGFKTDGKYIEKA